MHNYEEKMDELEKTMKALNALKCNSELADIRELVRESLERLFDECGITKCDTTIALDLKRALYISDFEVSGFDDYQGTDVNGSEKWFISIKIGFYDFRFFVIRRFSDGWEAECISSEVGHPEYGTLHKSNHIENATLAMWLPTVIDVVCSMVNEEDNGYLLTDTYVKPVSHSKLTEKIIQLLEVECEG